jgi:predicted ester cyclase
VKGSDEARRVVLEYWDAMNRGDMDEVAGFWADDSSNFGRPVGRQGVLVVLRDIQETFPDRRFDPIHTTVEGEWVTVRGTYSGTHKGIGRLPVNGGLLVGVQPTGRRFEVSHIHMMRVVDGLIVEHWANRDDLGMLQQLGLIGDSL